MDKIKMETKMERFNYGDVGFDIRFQVWVDETDITKDTKYLVTLNGSGVTLRRVYDDL